MKRPTLVGRVAVIQVGITAAVLAGVLGLSFFVVTHILTRDWDRALAAAAALVEEEIREQPDRAVGAWLVEDLEDHRPPGARIEVRGPNGSVVAAYGPGPPLDGPAVRCANIQRGSWRACAVTVGPYVVRVGRSRGEGLAARDRFLGVTAAVTLGVALLLALLARRVTARALAPLSHMASRIARVKPGSGARIGARSGLAELDHLAVNFDDLLGRVDAALARERRFSAEASHELRTPLTVLRGELESLVAGVPTADARRALRSVDHLSALVEALLWFTRTQEVLEPDALEPVNLADLAREQAGTLGGRYPDRALEIEAPDEVLVRADERLLGRAIGNVLENALKYSHAGGHVRLRCQAGDSEARLVIEDDGRGIPAEARDRIFEPFFREAKVRSQVAGFGLGLPLARAVVRALGGDLLLDPAHAPGSRFELRLPATYRA
jgi:signal transduction histidine kinase